MNEWRRAMLCYAAYHATLSELKIMNKELERSTTLFDPRKEITEIKELAEKGETHANELLKRLVALLHKLFHESRDPELEVSPPPPADPSVADGPPAVPEPNQQPSNIGGDEPVQEPA